MRLVYASSYQCDICEVVETVREPTDLRGLNRLPKMPSWITEQFTIHTNNRNYSPDICPRCARQPLQDILLVLLARYAEDR